MTIERDMAEPIPLGEGSFGKVTMETMKIAVRKWDNFRQKEKVESLVCLNHKNLIKIYSHHYEENGRRLVILMEFADKGTFTEVITKAAAEEDPRSDWFKEFNIWRVLDCLSSALNHLHSQPQPILHLNLKPCNILAVTKPASDGGRYIEWKISDYGLVSMLEENAQGDFYAQNFCCPLSADTYMAPEVWTNYKGCTSLTDIWSLGAIMAFHCNRGKHLFQVTAQDLEYGMADNVMAKKMREWKGLPLGTIRGFSNDLVQLIERMVHPDDNRRPSAEEIGSECTKARRVVVSKEVQNGSEKSPELVHIWD